ncbi:hypothetical protein [Nioella nitratireducens]|uniref:hypothetical protein n=1 Tax=Nioella nitratireducens TaxID=1287720 RepID=UPI0009FE72A6|nr:hypothetical protein [Nioella nitratireducens]
MGQCPPSRDTSPLQEPRTAGDLLALVNRMSCACADRAGHANAPLARDVFWRVEIKRQKLEEATREMGIGAGDGAYLLAGLRGDVAVDLVATLLAVPTAARTE